MTKIAILGGGQIGEALTSGLVESGFNASDITVTNRTAARALPLAGLAVVCGVVGAALALPAARRLATGRPAPAVGDVTPPGV